MRRRASHAARGLPPGPGELRVVQLARWLRSPIEFLEECERRYGECFTLRLPANPPFVVFTNPTAIRDIFTGDPEDLRAGEANVLLKSVLGENSLLLLDGQRHVRERKLMLPPFHGERMRSYGETMRATAARVIDGWPRGRAFPVHAEMQAITLEVILRTVFGLAEDGGRLERMRALLTRWTELGTAPLGTFMLMFIPSRYAEQIRNSALAPVQLGPLRVDLSRLVPWGPMVKAGRAVDEFLRDEFAARRRAAGDGPAGETRDDVLSLLMDARDEQGQPMSDDELRDEMMTLLLAGHETSATTLAWAVHHVLGNPPVLAELRRELATLGGAGVAGAGPDALQKLEYLDATIKETLRLTPIIPVVARKLTRPLRVGGHDLPAGVFVLPSIWLTHHRADLWPAPQRFDPTRFVGKKTDPYQYLPFGGGARRCLGMAFANYEMKIVLAEVLTRADLRAAPGSRVRLVRRGITFAPSGGVPVVAQG